ncbi:MAG: O-antigen ligase family protein [Verrucomicrobiota bacterium]
MKILPLTRPAGTRSPSTGEWGAKIYTLTFGLFLGLCLWKFGNPVILGDKISAPATGSDFLNNPWPPHWANWVLLPLAIIGGLLVFKNRTSGHSDKSAAAGTPIFHLSSSIYHLLPLAWLGWQFISATRTVDPQLTVVTLWQFFGCVACYFLGMMIFSTENRSRWLLFGVLTAFTFCLVRAVDQRWIEFPQTRQMLAAGEYCGWTNFPPENVAAMKRDGIIINTNGADVVNPGVIAKFQKNRAFGTLVYPNALAGIILLLWPVSLALAYGATKKMKSPIRLGVIALAVLLGSAALNWSGSKLGWLIGIGMAGLCLLRCNWPKKLKLAAVATVLILGLSVFAVRFQSYFAGGATSAGARLDYWHAAIQTTVSHPLWGTGPGTFQRPYAQLKAPEAEMARLTHNDYLEQFSDSGLIGGFSYAAWIMIVLAVIGKKAWQSGDGIEFAIYAGLLGWFVQGLGEFGLYVPALAWTAFSLLGALITPKRIEIDKKPESG